VKKILVLFSLLLAGLSYAHDDATMAAMHAPHGGELKMVGWYHFEFVANKTEASVYLTDHAGNAKPSKGVQATLAVVSGDKPQTLTLQTVEPNQLKAKLKQPLAAGAKVDIKLTMADGRSEQVSYTVAAAKHH
jgi:hypothetical protein